MTHETTICTAFQGMKFLVTGPVAEVVLALRNASEDIGILVFDDRTGRQMDLDIRGVMPAPEVSSEPRGRGRPKLGVVAREVTLLPRHWDWLSAQPGGASVALRKLVEDARKASGDKDRVRAAQEAAYNFMSAMAGNLPGFEEAARALFAHDRRGFAERIAGWPVDIRDHAVKLAFADRLPAES
ncbi:MAG: DUF2239 family protein [Bryobacteraceae bacterium]